MHTLVRGLLLLALTTQAACLRSTEFRCNTSAECGTGGTCETSVGYCAISDSGCASGQRFSDTAGSYAGQCVVDQPPMIDGGPDGPIDAPIDGPPAGCPGGYAAITGGQGNHMYRVVPSGNWSSQVSFCAATSTSAYLAIPDDANELAGLATLAATTPFWVGISDQQTEGTFLTVKNTTQTFLPGTVLANNGMQEDCVAGTSGTALDVFRCNVQHVAVCECEP